MDATCTIQDSIHVFSLVHKYVSRILGTYQNPVEFFYSYFYIMPGLLPVLHSVLQLRGLDQFRVP